MRKKNKKQQNQEMQEARERLSFLEIQDFKGCIATIDSTEKWFKDQMKADFEKVGATVTETRGK